MVSRVVPSFRSLLFPLYGVTLYCHYPFSRHFRLFAKNVSLINVCKKRKEKKKEKKNPSRYAVVRIHDLCERNLINITSKILNRNIQLLISRAKYIRILKFSLFVLPEKKDFKALF